MSSRPQKRKNHPKRKPLPAWLRRLLSISLGSAIFLAIILTIVAISYTIMASKFDLTKVTEIDSGSRVVDRQGETLLMLQGKARRLAKRDDLPPFLVKALLAREDKSFYQHGGVDWTGIGRATLRNIKDRSFTQGASTLSMQLARNTYEIRAKSLNRKLLEIALTRRIEKEYSKDDILTHYLNRIYFGSGAYGIAEASSRYFNKPVNALNECQCATLIGLIRGPHIYNPINNLTASQQQRNQVLNRMIATGDIDRERAEEIKTQKLQLSPHSKAPDDQTYSTQAVRRHLNEIASSLEVNRSGVVVTSTLDKTIQADLETLIDRSLKALETENLKNSAPLQVAAAVIDHHSGAIRALTGGRNYQRSPLNRALDEPRPIGPLMEPFLNALVRERALVPIVGSPIETGRQLGHRETSSLLPRFGFTAPFPAGNKLYLGFSEMSVLQLSSALAAFSNKGHYPRSYFIESITESSDQILFQNNPRLKLIIAPEAIETGILHFPKLPHPSENKNKTLSTRRAQFFHNRSKRDLWVIIISPEHTAVLWFGYDKKSLIKVSPKAKSTIRAAIIQSSI